MLTFTRLVTVDKEIDDFITACANFPYFPTSTITSFILFFSAFMSTFTPCFYQLNPMTFVDIFFCDFRSFRWSSALVWPAFEQRCQRLATNGNVTWNGFCDGDGSVIRDSWLDFCRLKAKIRRLLRRLSVLRHLPWWSKRDYVWYLWR